MSNEIVIRIQVPDGVKVDVEYNEVPQEPAYLAELPPVAAPQTFAQIEATPRPPQPSGETPVPQCPQHGPMTFFATKKDGTPMPRYTCTAKVGDGFCPTKPVWVK